MLPVIDFLRISLRKRSILGMIFLLILVAVPASADAPSEAVSATADAAPSELLLAASAATFALFPLSL